MELSSNSFEFIPRIKNTFFFNDFSKINKKNYIFLFGFIFIFFILIFSFFGGNGSMTSSITFFFIEIFILIIIIYIISVNFNNNGYSYDTKLDNLFNNKKLNLDIKLKDNKNNKCKGSDDNKSEVFHIPNNLYTYEEARKVCSNNNSRLATYNEIENAYKNGATWCSYGWSEEQMALFPTQESVIKELKTKPGHENDCGRQGVNGGYIDNQYIKFGVNCFGEKPEQTDKDKAYIEILKHSHSSALDHTNYDKTDNKLISPFNNDKWSMI